MVEEANSGGGAGSSPSADRVAAVLTIGELETQTGVAAATLRAWEQRVGFPVPHRTHGGQRRYRLDDVTLVRRVVAARERGLSLHAAVTALRQEPTTGSGSLFAQLRAAHPQLEALTVGMPVMKALTFAIEDQCLARASRPIILGCFQDQASFRAAGGRWRELARSARRAIAFSDFARTDGTSSPERVALPADSPMLNEWALICLDEALSLALVAWQHPRTSTREPRRFEGVLSLEPAVVADAARRCFAAGQAADSLEPLDLDVITREADRGAATFSSLMRRFAVYVDA